MAGKPPHVYLIAAARKVWYWGEARKAAIRAASVGPDLVQCACCRKILPKKKKGLNGRLMYQVDHIEPIVRPGEKSPTLNKEQSTDFLSWDVFLWRLNYSPQQVLCLSCHKEKTNKENKQRRVRRKA